MYKHGHYRNCLLKHFNVAYEVRDDNGLVKVKIMFAVSIQRTNAQDDSNNYLDLEALRNLCKQKHLTDKH